MDIFLIIGLVSAVLSATWSSISLSLGIVTIAGFLGWSTFYAAGGKKAGFKLGLFTTLSGVFWGFATTQLSIIITPYIGGKAAFALTAGLGSLIMCYQARFKLLAFIPGSFIGCSTYFATGLSLKSSIIGLIVGACIGYISERAVEIISSSTSKEASVEKIVEDEKDSEKLTSVHAS